MANASWIGTSMKLGALAAPFAVVVMWAAVLYSPTSGKAATLLHTPRPAVNMAVVEQKMRSGAGQARSLNQIENLSVHGPVQASGRDALTAP